MRRGREHGCPWMHGRMALMLIMPPPPFPACTLSVASCHAASTHAACTLPTSDRHICRMSHTDLNAPETGLLLDHCRGAKFVVIAGDVVGGAKTDDKVRECMPDSRACMQGSSHKAKLHLKCTFLSHRFVEDKTFILITSPYPCVHGPPLPSRAGRRGPAGCS